MAVYLCCLSFHKHGSLIYFLEFSMSFSLLIIVVKNAMQNNKMKLYSIWHSLLHKCSLFLLYMYNESVKVDIWPVLFSNLYLIKGVFSIRRWQQMFDSSLFMALDSKEITTNKSRQTQTTTTTSLLNIEWLKIISLGILMLSESSVCKNFNHHCVDINMKLNEEMK